MERRVIYEFIHSKMIEKSNNITYVMDLNKAKRIISNFGIPKYLTYQVIKEMQDLKLIERINKDSIRIKRKKTKDGWF